MIVEEIIKQINSYNLIDYMALIRSIIRNPIFDNRSSNKNFTFNFNKKLKQLIKTRAKQILKIWKDSHNTLDSANEEIRNIMIKNGTNYFTFETLQILKIQRFFGNHLSA